LTEAGAKIRRDDWLRGRSGRLCEPLAHSIQDALERGVRRRAGPVFQVHALPLAEEQRRLAGLDEHLQQSPLPPRRTRFGLDVVAGDRRRRPGDDHELGRCQLAHDGGLPRRVGRDVLVAPDADALGPQRLH